MAENITTVTQSEVLSMSPRLIVVVLSIAGNLLILHVIHKSRHFSQVTRHLISHLAVADILYCAVMCLHLCFLLAGIMSHPACLVIMPTAGLCALTSCWGICLVFLDNYLSVRRINDITKSGLSLRQARVCIVAGWLGAGIYFVVFVVDAPKDVPIPDCRLGGPAYTPNSTMLLWIFLMLLSVTVLIFMFVTLRIVKKRMNAVFPDTQDEGNHFSLSMFLRQEHMKRRAKITRTFVIIAVGFLVSYGPVTITLCLFTICPQCGITKQTLATMVSFTMLNACCNVIVYFIKDNAFRKEVVRRIPCLKSRTNNQIAINLVNIRHT